MEDKGEERTYYAAFAREAGSDIANIGYGAKVICPTKTP
jgi:hypothetical protein